MIQILVCYCWGWALDMINIEWLGKYLPWLCSGGGRWPVEMRSGEQLSPGISAAATATM